MMNFNYFGIATCVAFLIAGATILAAMLIERMHERNRQVAATVFAMTVMDELICEGLYQGAARDEVLEDAEFYRELYLSEY